VLSMAQSTAARMKADAKPAGNLYLAGDWTLNGLNAGCVEAAVMSGIQAARTIRGVPAYTMPGASDWP
jgi:predicted NAD/FAD-dependent oxidoreductase